MRQVLETWARRVWEERDEAAIDALRATDATSHGLGQQTLASTESFKQFHRDVCSLLQDTRLSIDHDIESGGWIAVLCTFSGTTGSGQRVRMSGSIHARIADGKIQEAYNNFDFLGLFARMGLLPADSFQRCIKGRPDGS
jgi:hypothetical protein